MSRSKVKGQGHQGQKPAFLALSATCVRFMFGKTSLASSFKFCRFTALAYTTLDRLLAVFFLYDICCFVQVEEYEYYWKFMSFMSKLIRDFTVFEN